MNYKKSLADVLLFLGLVGNMLGSPGCAENPGKFERKETFDYGIEKPRVSYEGEINGHKVFYERGRIPPYYRYPNKISESPILDFVGTPDVLILERTLTDGTKSQDVFVDDDRNGIIDDSRDIHVRNFTPSGEGSRENVDPSNQANQELVLSFKYKDGDYRYSGCRYKSMEGSPDKGFPPRPFTDDPETWVCRGYSNASYARTDVFGENLWYKGARPIVDAEIEEVLDGGNLPIFIKGLGVDDPETMSLLKRHLESANKLYTQYLLQAKERI